jgi:DNA-binding NarL/FixJ family response regulator
MESGAQGYVLKHSAPVDLSEAMRGALRGKTYIRYAVKHGIVVG